MLQGSGYAQGVEYYQNKDYKNAYPILLSAAASSNAEAQMKLGHILQELPNSLTWFEADGDCLAAQLVLAEYYEKQRDFKQAIYWNTKAAEQHHDAIALASLGWFYFEGLGVDQNDVRAEDYFLKSIQNGDPSGNGHAGMGLVYQKQGKVAEAIEYFHKAATEQNCGLGMNGLGDIYCAQKEYAKALTWYQKAANLGCYDGQYNMGKMFQEGLGVEVDHSIALSWFQKSFQNGNEKAKAYLDV